LEAIILAGGLGTRLQQIVSDVPKAMALVNGKPFIEYLLNYLRGQGITKFILSVGFKKETIRDYLKDQYKNIPVVYAVEEEPLGTGGGISHAFQLIEGENAFVLNGDSMFRMGLNAMTQLHEEKKADITLALRYLDETGRFGTVTIDEEKRITGFREKGAESGPGYINGGIYLIRKSFLLGQHFPPVFSIEKDCFEKSYRDQAFYGFPSRGYFLDIGVPEDFYKSQHEFRAFDD
jgi:D-glycero-alpha-D-manno-heptose 1-phosphate guanylyltransferase